MSRLGARSIHIRDQVMAALAERGQPMLTRDVEAAVCAPPGEHQVGVGCTDVYAALARLAKRGEIVRLPNPFGGARAPAIWLCEPADDATDSAWDVLRDALETS